MIQHYIVENKKIDPMMNMTPGNGWATPPEGAFDLEKWMRCLGFSDTIHNGASSTRACHYVIGRTKMVDKCDDVRFDYVNGSTGVFSPEFMVEYGENDTYTTYFFMSDISDYLYIMEKLTKIALMQYQLKEVQSH